MIRSIWKLLTALPDDPQVHTVMIDDLHTMLAGAQCILNARPLAAINNRVDDHQAVMPLNFITSTSDTSAMDPITDLSTHGKILASYSGIQSRVDYL